MWLGIYTTTFLNVTCFKHFNKKYENVLLSIKYNLTRLGGPAPDQNCITKLYQVVWRVMRVQVLAGFKGVGVYDL